MIKSRLIQPNKGLVRYIVTSIPIFSVIVLLMWWYAVGRSIIVERPRMERYLNDKYTQEFMVSNLKTRGGGFGTPGLRVGVAHPANDSSLTFEAGESRSTGKFFDGYSGAVWAREERPRVAAFLKEVYSSSPAPDFDLTTHIPTAAEPDPIQGKVPSISNAIAHYGDNFQYSIGIKLVIDHDLSQDETRSHTVKMKQIINFVLAKNISSPAVRYAINVEGGEFSYLCNLYKGELADQSKIDSCLTKIHGKSW